MIAFCGLRNPGSAERIRPGTSLASRRRRPCTRLPAIRWADGVGKGGEPGDVCGARMAGATYQYNGRAVAAAYSITDERIRQLEEVTYEEYQRPEKAALAACLALMNLRSVASIPDADSLQIGKLLLSSPMQPAVYPSLAPVFVRAKTRGLSDEHIVKEVIISTLSSGGGAAAMIEKIQRAQTPVQPVSPFQLSVPAVKPSTVPLSSPNHPAHPVQPARNWQSQRGHRGRAD